MLSDFEKGEILSYKTIYYINQCTSPIKNKSELDERFNRNNGFDDERGDFKLIVHDQVMYRFEIVARLGKGSFGQVVKAFDHKTQQFVALKVIRNKKRFHKQAIVEVRLLDHLKTYDVEDNKNVVKMEDYFLWRNHLVSLN